MHRSSRNIVYSVVFTGLGSFWYPTVANALASLFMLIITALYLDSHPSYPGSEGPCGYLLAIMTSLYISTFFLTLGYALEAFIRLHRRLQSYLSLEGIRTDGVSNVYMYVVYFVSWCYPAFSAQDGFCWSHVEMGRRWQLMYKLIFLVPLLLVFILNMRRVFVSLEITRSHPVERRVKVELSLSLMGYTILSVFFVKVSAVQPRSSHFQKKCFSSLIPGEGEKI
nr:hypothetical protein BaRGS_019829 [Batillaria attramentaria]